MVYLPIWKFKKNQPFIYCKYIPVPWMYLWVINLHDDILGDSLGRSNVLEVGLQDSIYRTSSSRPETPETPPGSYTTWSTPVVDLVSKSPVNLGENFHNFQWIQNRFALEMIPKDHGSGWWVVCWPFWKILQYSQNWFIFLNFQGENKHR